MQALQLVEAISAILEHVRPVTDTEQVPVGQASGRVLAEDIAAGHDQPPFPRSPLDGYAVRSGDLQAASREHPARLQVIDEIMAGYVSEKKIAPGQAVRLMTGAPVPEGADTIVRQEDTDYGMDLVQVFVSQRPWQNYCFQGEDFKTGDLLMRKGQALGPAEIGILSSVGKTSAEVFRRPRVLLFTTGDEVLLPGQPLQPGKIYDSNLHTNRAQLEMWGCQVRTLGVLSDDAPAVAALVRKEAEEADLIVSSGGVSVGKKDIMHEVIRLLGAEQIFWRVAIKPGMPTLAADYDGRPMICLSGNPYGAFVNLHLLVKPALQAMAGRSEDPMPEQLQAVLQNSYLKKSRVTRYIRAYHRNGQVRIADGSNDSGVISNICGCNCLVAAPAGSAGLLQGETVTIFPF